MIRDLWTYLTAPENRETLTWLGGGLAVVAGALWTVVTFFLQRPEAPRGGGAPASAPSQEMLADRGGLAAGRDISLHSGNTTTVRNGLGGWRLVMILALLAGIALVAITQVGSRVSATEGSIAIGDDVNGSTITVGD